MIRSAFSHNETNVKKVISTLSLYVSMCVRGCVWPILYLSNNSQDALRKYKQKYPFFVRETIPFLVRDTMYEP
jgi:hypothetical protein